MRHYIVIEILWDKIYRKLSIFTVRETDLSGRNKLRSFSIYKQVEKTNFYCQRRN